MYDELKRLFKKKSLNDVSQEEMQQNIGSLKEINAKIIELNRQNNLLKAKYNNDPKYCRIHKRLATIGLTQRETTLFEALQSVKNDADTQVINNSRVLENEGYMDKMMIRLIINHFVKENKINLNPETSKFINNLVVQEYINEYHGRIA